MALTPQAPRSELEVEDSPQLLPHEKCPPDQGLRAWLCVFGSFCGVMGSFGYTNIMGVFQQYYEVNQLASYSPSTISWITSLQTFVLTAGAIVVGPLFDKFGSKPLILPGVLLMILGVMTTSVSKEYYQFILAQGVCTSLGSSLVFTTCIASVSTWFVKKRGTALGIVTSGAALGGTIMPLIFHSVNNRAGFGWAARSLGFLNLGLGLIACVCVSSRIRPRGRGRKSEELIEQSSSTYDEKQPSWFRRTYITPLSSPSFSFLTAAVFCVYLGAYVPLNYLPSFARDRAAFSEDMAGYLPSIQMGATTLGRILPSIFADKVGRFNVFIAGSFLAGIFTLSLWIPAHTKAQVIAYGAVYGFAAGPTTAIWMAMIAEISPVQSIGARFGICSVIASVAALTGSPISGALLGDDRTKYYAMAIFSGVLVLVAAGLAFVSKAVYKKDNWRALM
ncbi:major facilitator superfamily domain-containing protein [Myxozyma melibiosi]|uniref:Major facilitator superfamily domain-containing protein n=1 Tax=Myxozyma melibiosi TaxID=54550 RepID=A0ABR1F0C1_9ASCO